MDNKYVGKIGSRQLFCGKQTVSKGSICLGERNIIGVAQLLKLSTMALSLLAILDGARVHKLKTSSSSILPFYREEGTQTETLVQGGGWWGIYIN